jgi:hypothetical protein
MGGLRVDLDARGLWLDQAQQTIAGQESRAGQAIRKSQRFRWVGPSEQGLPNNTF